MECVEGAHKGKYAGLVRCNTGFKAKKTKEDCTGCEHYEKIDDPPFVMKCSKTGIAVDGKYRTTDRCACHFKPKPDKPAASCLDDGTGRPCEWYRDGADAMRIHKESDPDGEFGDWVLGAFHFCYHPVSVNKNGKGVSVFSPDIDDVHDHCPIPKAVVVKNKFDAVNFEYGFGLFIPGTVSGDSIRIGCTTKKIHEWMALSVEMVDDLLKSDNRDGDPMFFPKWRGTLETIKLGIYEE